jgi:hypothetical protein
VARDCARAGRSSREANWLIAIQVRLHQALEQRAGGVVIFGADEDLRERSPAFAVGLLRQAAQVGIGRVALAIMQCQHRARLPNVGILATQRLPADQVLARQVPLLGDQRDAGGLGGERRIVIEPGSLGKFARCGRQIACRQRELTGEQTLQHIVFRRRRRKLDARQWLLGTIRPAALPRRQTRTGTQGHDGDGECRIAPTDREPELHHCPV